MAFGAAFMLAPGLAARGWIGDDAQRPAVKVLARGFGVRDAAIGLGIAVALDRGAPVRGWLEAAAVSDGVDLAATLLAGGSALLCAALARALDTPPAEHELSVPEAHLTGHP